MHDTVEPPLIVCFGDSLTVGYQSPTPDSPMLRETPYGARLQERLGSGVLVMVRGVCGEVTGEMALRFRQDVLNHRPHSVVILGGTNDLGWNADPAEIMRNLLKMYEQSLGAGVRPVAVTVPSIRLEGDPEESRSFLADHLARRRNLNDLIGSYSRRKGIPCVDFFTATAEPETLCLAARYSNDGLHLTTDGYARLADLLYEQVFSAGFPSLERSHKRDRGGRTA